jgi:hypothetical protein
LPDGIFPYQKSQFWVYFGGPWNAKCWYILWPFGIFYGNSGFHGNLVYFEVRRNFFKF